MSKRAVGIAFLLGAVLLVGCHEGPRGFQALRAVPAEDAPWEFGPRVGHHLRTQHYDIYTTLDDLNLIQALPQMLESGYVYYQQLIPPERRPDERMPAYLFVTREEFVQFTRSLAPEKASKLVQVQFGGYSEDGVSVMRYGTHQATYSLMAHEAFHQYLRNCVQEHVPAWINEGLATLCEGQRWGAQGLKWFDPGFNPQRRNDLAELMLQERTLPLKELLEINAGHVVGTTNSRIRAYYAQVWALTLFLMDSPYADQYHQLRMDLSGGPWEARARAAFVGAAGDEQFNVGRELFRAYIDPDIAKVEAQWRQYIYESIIQREPQARWDRG